MYVHTYMYIILYEYTCIHTYTHVHKYQMTKKRDYRKRAKHFKQMQSNSNFGQRQFFSDGLRHIIIHIRHTHSNLQPCTLRWI